VRNIDAPTRHTVEHSEVMHAEIGVGRLVVHPHRRADDMEVTMSVGALGCPQARFEPADPRNRRFPG
jgi:hypothetical protein